MTEEVPESLRELLAGLAKADTTDADLVLMQLDPEPARLLELCAIPHLFDPALVRVLDPATSPELIDQFIEEVQALPSIRQVGDCFALHDIVRGQLFERWLQPERRAAFTAASSRLAQHYAKLSQGGRNAAEANESVLVFHWIGADPDVGFREFQALYNRYRDTARFSACEALVRLVDEYRPLFSDRQHAWLAFYAAEVARDGRDLVRAQSLLTELTHRELEATLAVRAHVSLSAVLRGLRRYKAALEPAQRALQLASSSADGGTLLHLVYQELGLIAREQGDAELASRHLYRTIELGTVAGDRLVVASAYNSLGTVLQRLDPRKAIEVLQAGAGRLTAPTDAVRRAQVLNNLGLAYANVGEWSKAQQSYDQSLEIKRAAADLYGQALTLLNIARVFIARRQMPAARNSLTESLSLFRATRDSSGAVAAGQELARVLRQSGEAEDARREATAAIALLKQLDRAAEAEALAREFGLAPKRKHRWLGR
jgi:tetratricopeptide (TPR) repeat protein